jgi:hypothetical protein
MRTIATCLVLGWISLVGLAAGAAPPAPTLVSANAAGNGSGNLASSTSRRIDTPQRLISRCGRFVAFTSTATDLDGDALTVRWSVDGGTPDQTETVGPEGPPTNETVTFTRFYKLGEHTVRMTGTAIRSRPRNRK